jgi:hypothetical protein
MPWKTAGLSALFCSGVRAEAVSTRQYGRNTKKVSVCPLRGQHHRVSGRGDPFLCSLWNELCGDHQQKTVSIIINSEGKVMAKGQKRSNREPKKPKRPKQKTSPASSSAAQTKAVAGDRGKRK